MSAASFKIASGFSRHVTSYEEAALAQRQIAQELAGQIGRVMRVAPKCLELGHGTGFLTRHLLKLAPQRLWLNDLAATMPNLIWPKDMQICLLSGDAQDIPLPPEVDLIASASMLQWVSDPAGLITRAFDALRKGGILAISSFGPDMFAELSRYGIVQGAPSYQNAQALAACLPENAEILFIADASITLTFPNARAVFSHLRATGVNGLCAGRFSAPRLRALMLEMEQEAALTLTYRPSYCIARKL